MSTKGHSKKRNNERLKNKKNISNNNEISNDPERFIASNPKIKGYFIIIIYF